MRKYVSEIVPLVRRFMTTLDEVTESRSPVLLRGKDLQAAALDFTLGYEENSVCLHITDISTQGDFEDCNGCRASNNECRGPLRL